MSTGVEASVVSGLSAFSRLYAGIHGYVSLVVCLLGVVSNVFIVIVLTQKVMVNPTSRILTALAVSDLVTMLSYIPFAIRFYVLHPQDSHEPQLNGIAWMHYFLVHVHLSVTAHTVSIWLGVLLSIYRYSYVRDPGAGGGGGGGSIVGSARAVSCAIGVVYVFSVVAMIPNYMSLRIVRIGGDDDDVIGVHSTSRSNRTVVDYDADDGGDVIAKQTMAVRRHDDGGGGVGDGDAANRSGVSVGGGDYYDVIGFDVTDEGRGAIITRLNFWIHALLVKLLPCALMSVFGLLIVCAVRSTHRKGSLLRKNSTRADTVTLRRRENNRTTSMLVAVIVLFLVTELPQGVLALLSGILDGFFERYYTPLGDLMDIVALINNGINFSLYCAMSNRFRSAFLALFCPWCSSSADGKKIDIRREMVTLRTIMLTVNAHGKDKRRTSSKT